MKSFTARATRSRRWWAVTVDEDPRVQTQARRLDQVEAVARCVLVDALVLGPADQAKFTVVVDADELEPLRQAALLARTNASAATEQAGEAAVTFALKAAEAGMPLRDIGAMLGVSHQRAHQLLDRRTA
jgi:hypothetical protein